jgi:CubicO group peptidase (beta-lactamase class C family)
LGYAEAFIRGVLGLDGSWLPLSYPDDVMTFMKGFEGWVEARPGERFFYLNEGYVILGKVVERVSGISYEDFVRRNILEPLGMKRSYFRREEVEGDPDVAVGYVIDRDGRHVKSRFPYGVTADGGLLSNPLDMARYTVMLLNRGVYNGVELLSPRMVELAESIHARLPYESMVADGYGYGLMVKEDFLGRKLVGHGGSVLTYTAYVFQLHVGIRVRRGVLLTTFNSMYDIQSSHRVTPSNLVIAPTLLKYILRFLSLTSSLIRF